MFVAVVVVVAAVVVVDVLVGTVKYLQTDSRAEAYTYPDCSGCLLLPVVAEIEWLRRLPVVAWVAWLPVVACGCLGSVVACCCLGG